jgi:hypothetical protein
MVYYRSYPAKPQEIRGSSLPHRSYETLLLDLRTAWNEFASICDTNADPVAVAAITNNEGRTVERNGAVSDNYLWDR